MPDFITPPPSDDQLDRYLAGELGDRDRDAVEAWLAATPDVERLRLVTQRMSVHTPSPQWTERDARLKWETVRGQIGQPRTASRPHLSRSTRPRRRIQVIGGTLAAGLVLGAGVWGMLETRKDSSISPSHVYTTGIAERATIRLPDGSTVQLAPQSRLAYSEDRAGHRHSKLDGMAAFHVIHAQRQQFQVTSHDVATTVLGTEFVVQHYTTDSAVSVAVVSGKVQTRNKTGSPVTLTPGDHAWIADSSAAVTSGVNPSTFVDWTDGHLSFDETPIPVMLATISRWYGYEFQLADSTLASRRVTVRFAIGKREELFKTLRALLGVSTQITGKTVVLMPTPNTSRRSVTPARVVANLPLEKSE